MEGIKVLIIENNNASDFIISKNLELKGYTILDILQSGAGAVQAIEKEVPDIIVINIMLPGDFNVIKTAEIIQKTTNIPIVFISEPEEYLNFFPEINSPPLFVLIKPIQEHQLDVFIKMALYLKKVEGKVKNSEQQFRMLSDFSPDTITLHKMDTEEIMYINKKRLFGYDKEEFIKLPKSAIFSQEDLNKLKIFKRKVEKSFGKESPSIELKIKNKNNTWEWINLRQSIIEKNKSGKSGLLLSVITSITDKKQFELELVKTNFELDNFVYRASHDLRAPMKSIMGLVNLIKIESDEEKKMKYVDLINFSIMKLDNYISDMTNYSRNSKMDMEDELINFEEIYNTQMDNLQHKEGFNTIQKIFNLSQSVDFVSDPMRISILFGNMLSNAIKFQNIKKNDSFIKIIISINQEYASIIFIDNGIGVKRQYFEKLFEMFFRATDNTSGSGLGLYVVKQILNKLGGTIEINSDFGEGTTFKINLPNRKKYS